MPEQEQKKKRSTKQEPAPEELEVKKVESQDTLQDIDDILDEIDSVLEENAEEFVKAYRQKGGE